MRAARSILHAGVAVIAITVLSPAKVQACAACYGQSDSPLAAGMNWGILSLLGFIGLVLAGVAAFFIFLARRSGQREGKIPTQAMEQALFEDFAESWRRPGVRTRGEFRKPALSELRRNCPAGRKQRTSKSPASRFEHC
jgi:hypothetical protein